MKLSDLPAVPSLEALSAELSETPVLSEDFRETVLMYARSIAREAYAQGRNAHVITPIARAA